MKGILLLSMARSGTNWLNSISNKTGEMGKNGEWLGFEKLKKGRKKYTGDTYYDQIMQNATTPNERFAVKIFPRHLRQSFDFYNVDFIQKCATEHDVKFILLSRSDRVAQAISLVRARQTGYWTAGAKKNAEQKKPTAGYCFKSICQAYFHIGRGYDFWRSYLDINSYPYEEFIYESLTKDPSPYFQSVADHLGVPAPTDFQTKLKVQRDTTTQEWRERFMEDFSSQHIHPDTYQPLQPERGFSNAMRVLRGKPISMSYFGYQS